MGLSILRNGLKTLAEQVTSATDYELAPERIILGYDRLAETEEFFNTLLEDGPYLVITPGAKIEDTLGIAHTPAQKLYNITAYLWLAIGRESNNDFLDIEDFVEAIANKWREGIDNVMSAPDSISWQEPVLDVEKPNGAIVLYTFSIVARHC